jgi:DNA-binding NtrC family response regulator
MGLGVGLAVAKVLVGNTFQACGTVVSAIRDSRMVVVDENLDHRALLAESLRGRGYEVIEAQDASEALRLISGQKPDACVIDIGLPRHGRV